MGMAFCSFRQHGSLPSARIAIDAVKRLYLVGIGVVARLALLVVVLRIGGRRRRQRAGAGSGYAGARCQNAKEIATTERRLILLFHRRLLLKFLGGFSFSSRTASGRIGKP